MSSPGPSHLPSALLFVALLATACEGAPSASGLPEWTAGDHDRTEESARAATNAEPAGGGAPAPGARPGAARGPDPVLEATWAQQCAPCHGPVGHGDGPTGPMVHAADLTRADWQATITDEQLATAIVNGKGKMPRFPDLPAKIVAGLVARIRASRGR